MLDSALAMMACWVLNASLTGEPPARTGNGRTFVGAYGCYDASDARVMIGAATGRQNARMWRALGRDDLAEAVEDLRIRDLQDRRARDAATLGPRVSRWAARHTPSARVEAFGGHMMFWERAEEFNRVLSDFLEGCPE